MRKIAIAFCIAVASISVCRADDGPGTYFAPESGTANVVVQPKANPNAKIRKTVAFLGGSITEMHGYRPRVLAALRKKYPDVDFTEIAAGISSTCSDTGAFRLAEDVLAKGAPDLFFVEESVNDDQDGHFDRVHAIRGMEGIVRRVREKCPRCEIVVGLMVNRGQYDVRMSGKTPMICEVHAEVARHYGATIADVGAALAASAAAGGFSWTEYRDCHPSPAGCDFAADVIMNAIDAAFNPYAEAKVKALPHPMDEKSYFRGTVVPFASVCIDGGWNVSQPDWSKVPGSKREQFVQGDALWSETPGAEFSFSFRGTAAAAILTSGPDVGAVEVSVDGGEWRRVDLVSPYSRTLNYPNAKFFADGLPDAVHEIKVRLVEATHEWGGGKAVRINRLVVNGILIRSETSINATGNDCGTDTAKWMITRKI